MLEKLYDMGILSERGKLSEAERKVGVSRMARRRLGVVMTRLGMAENVSNAVRFVEQGHVRVGTEVVTDPAFLVVSVEISLIMCSLYAFGFSCYEISGV